MGMTGADIECMMTAARIVSSFCKMHDCDECPFFIVNSEVYDCCALNAFSPWNWFDDKGGVRNDY